MSQELTAAIKSPGSTLVHTSNVTPRRTIRAARYAASTLNTIDSPLLGLSQRLPPSNVQAEQALLGALLANNRAYERVSEFLAPEHFADPIHGRIYQAIARRIEAGQLADAVTLKAEFEHSGVLEEVGGTAYLAQLLTAMVGIINAGEYGRAIHDAWLRRQLIDIGETVVNNAFGADAELDGTQQIEAAEHSLFQLATDGAVDRRLHQLRARADRGDPRRGTGVQARRPRIRADHRAARPRCQDGRAAPVGSRDPRGPAGHGQDVARHEDRLRRRQGIAGRGARRPIPTRCRSAVSAVFSLEMSAEQLATRLLSEESRVSSDRIRRGDISQRDFDKFVQVSREIASLPIEIDDTPAITLSALRTRARRLKRTKGLSLIVVDYLQLMRPAAGTRPENRVLEIGQLTQGLKAIAKELAVPVLALSQLSRAVEIARGQAAAACRPAGIRHDRAGCRRGDVHLPRRVLPRAARCRSIAAFDNEDKFQSAHGRVEAADGSASTTRRT